MTETIERFLAQLATIEPEQARQMRVAWDAEDPEPRKAVWMGATDALKAAGRARELDELRAGVNAWAGDKAFNFIDAVGGDSSERTRQEARYRALPPVMDAGLAAVAADLLDVDQRYLLQKPYRAGVSGEAGRPRHSGRSPRRSPGR
jgi:hypothetical protein